MIDRVGSKEATSYSLRIQLGIMSYQFYEKMFYGKIMEGNTWQTGEEEKAMRRERQIR